jgi:uncharacterized linocin/CFP29 family protein
MNKLKYVGMDEPLTTEQGQYIREKAVQAAQRTFVGRKLFGTAVRKIDSSTQVFGYDVLTHVSDASVDFTWPGRMTLDIINLARSTVAIPNLHKEAELNKLDVASSRTSGTPLNTSQVESNAYKVAYLEDALLIMGYSADGTNYDINGLYKAAGNTKAGSDWATATAIATTINGAISELMTDNILPPYNVVLPAEQYAYTLAFVSGTAVSYLQWIKEIIQGEVYMSPVLTTGTGMMTKANPDGLFEYVLAEDITTETETLSIKEGNNLFIRVYLRGLPLVYDANAICTMTGLT